MQSTTIWTLRHSLDARRLGPSAGGRDRRSDRRLLLGSHRCGMLEGRDRRFLADYGVYALLAPRLPYVARARADAAVGFIAGIMGGLGGYSGVLPAIWTQLRGWPKTERAPSISPSS
jgi:hypothetical protein